MNLHFQYDCDNISFAEVINILQSVDMTYLSEEMQAKAFLNSTYVIFVFDANKLIGFARAISDNVIHTAAYDIAIHPDYQGKGIGKIILEDMKKQFNGCNIILVSKPGKENFYRKMGFHKLLTGMGFFENVQVRREKGFIE